uniref:NADH dehydrogenase subunit 6 n=1 Tax=Apsilochorema nigrum TaxID=1875165 RepID=UPI0022DCDF5D|nr:NADH dehydrogenase subunit 6 [Apsilochorema nigrum]UZZ43802.1 NADH dehydrogenase subunit 6 [Apsilochorema nigrum]
MKLILINLMMIISTCLLNFNHPLIMGLTVMVQTILISVLMGLIISSYWFSYILFLTFIGGLLILYIYVCSLAANEKFKFNITSIHFPLMFTIMIFIFSFYFMKNIISMNLDSSEWIEPMIIFNNENKIIISKIYNNYTMNLTLMMINYLFFTLIVIVKIINLKYGPLRSN